MNDYNEDITSVTRTLIPEEQRLSLTAKLFGAHFPMVIEPVVYGASALQVGAIPRGTTV
jgi:hypothetical protein